MNSFDFKYKRLEIGGGETCKNLTTAGYVIKDFSEALKVAINL